MSDDPERSYLPWTMAALVLVVGGAKLDSARPLLGRALAVAIPIVPVMLGVKRVEGGGEQLERAAGIVGWLTILAAETSVANGFFHVGGLDAVAPVARLALYATGPLALFVHVLEARSVGKARFAGYVGIAAAFALYLSTHAGEDAFSSVFGAFFLALLGGGTSGLLLGEVLGRVFKKD